MAWYDGMIGSATNSIFGMATGALNNWMAEQREAKARKENYEYGEMAADNADRRTRNLYNTFYSPQAQMSMMREAGLSPSLMAGQGAGIGGTGQAGAQGGGASGVNPNVFGISPINFAEQKLLEAQARNVDADTNLKNEQKNELTGENEMGRTKIAKMLAEAGASKAATELTKAQKTMQDLLNYIKDETKEFDINNALFMWQRSAWETETAFHEARSAKVKASVDEALKNEYIEQVRNENAEILARTAAHYANTKLSEQQIKNLQNDIQISLENLAVAQQNADTNAKNAKTASEANKIRKDELRAHIEIFNEEMKAKYKELGIEEDRMLFEFGEKIVENTHIGNQYSIITYDEEKVTRRQAKKK